MYSTKLRHTLQVFNNQLNFLSQDDDLLYCSEFIFSRVNVIIPCEEGPFLFPTYLGRSKGLCSQGNVIREFNMKCLPCSCHNSSHHFNQRDKVDEKCQKYLRQGYAEFSFPRFLRIKNILCFHIQFVFYFSCYKE